MRTHREAQQFLRQIRKEKKRKQERERIKKIKKRKVVVRRLYGFYRVCDAETGKIAYGTNGKPIDHGGKSSAEYNRRRGYGEVLTAKQAAQLIADRVNAQGGYIPGEVR